MSSPQWWPSGSSIPARPMFESAYLSPSGVRIHTSLAHNLAGIDLSDTDDPQVQDALRKYGERGRALLSENSEDALTWSFFHAMSKLPKEYRHEPELALAGGVDGLDFVKKLLRQSRGHLARGGNLIVELGHNRAALDRAYPDLPLTWLSVSGGDDLVFLDIRLQHQLLENDQWHCGLSRFQNPDLLQVQAIPHP